MKVYGLKNCDTCRKVRKDLDRANIAYEFHDVREDGVTTAQIGAWSKKAGWERLLNKSSTTWRKLDASDKAGLTEARAIALMAANPTLIKRPVIERGDTEILVGWSKDVAAALAK